MKEQQTNGGLGLGTVLFLIFLTLKLTEIGPVQYWSWWWITSPLWIPLIIVILIAIGVGVVEYRHYNRKKRKK
jgi:hypothetical protein